MAKKNYEIIITPTTTLNYSGRVLNAKLITLKKGEEIIFDKIKPFQAHKRLWDMGLQDLINW